MLRRQDTVLSSSMSRRENVPKQKGAGVGCMAGIVQLVTKSQTRRTRRFLITFVSGRKKQRKLDNQEEDVPSSASKVSKFPSIRCLETTNIMAQGIGDRKKEEEVGDKFHSAWRLSSQVPRSPTLPAEIRRSNNNNNIPSAILAPASADKGRKVLGALEKCNEDLKAIQKILESLRPDAGLPTMLPISTNGGNGLMVEQTRRPRPRPQEQARGWKSPIPRPKQTEETTGRLEWPLSLSFFHRVAAATATATASRSKALTESVNEICRDIEWGEKREVGRMGLVLQDHICRDLILEFVKDFTTSTAATPCDSMHSLPLLPLDSCKRRLPF